MKLLCHRGVWKAPNERNSAAALNLALDRGLGIETDIRDCDGRLVISHDMPTCAAFGSLENLLEHYRKGASRSTLALNIKSDGLQNKLKDALSTHGVANYFVFDMSVPDTLGYRRVDMNFAVRLSEFESESPLLESASHVWLDAFSTEWYSIDLIRQLIERGKHVAVVSPELHRRPHREWWAALREVESKGRLHLCTDWVDEAMEVFDVEKD
ncbi:MAG TPA: hypothetical protein VFM48_06780 [Aquabacterium sp.]|nr:hypothetical protein [Aquabacterium sp.]